MRVVKKLVVFYLNVFFPQLAKVSFSGVPPKRFDSDDTFVNIRYLKTILIIIR